MRVGKIYIITNDINNKVYIGQTIMTLKKRFSAHCCYNESDKNKSMYIKRAIHKYGREHFKISLIEECSLDNLNEREKYWIEFYDSYNNGYNLTLGGSSNYFSLHRLEETIDIKKFEQYIIEFKPLARDVAKHFGICKSSVYNLIKRLDNPLLILNSYNHKKARTIADINSDELLLLYKKGWKIKDLVKKYHVRKNKISRFLKSKGIKIRRSYKYNHRI